MASNSPTFVTSRTDSSYGSDFFTEDLLNRRHRSNKGSLSAGSSQKYPAISSDPRFQKTIGPIFSRSDFKFEKPRKLSEQSQAILGSREIALSTTKLIDDEQCATGDNDYDRISKLSSLEQKYEMAALDTPPTHDLLETFCQTDFSMFKVVHNACQTENSHSNLPSSESKLEIKDTNLKIDSNSQLILNASTTFENLQKNIRFSPIDTLKVEEKSRTLSNQEINELGRLTITQKLFNFFKQNPSLVLLLNIFACGFTLLVISTVVTFIIPMLYDSVLGEFYKPKQEEKESIDHDGFLWIVHVIKNAFKAVGKIFTKKRECSISIFSTSKKCIPV